MRFAYTFAFTLTVVAYAVSPTTAQEGNRLFFVKVTKATELQGQFVELSELNVATAFGEVTIPIEKIEAVKMRAAADDSAVIAFTNGDLITGKITMDELKLKTNWGNAYIQSDSIESISSTEFGRFYTDPSAGGWRYSRGNASPSNNNLNSPPPSIQGSGTNFSR